MNKRNSILAALLVVSTCLPISSSAGKTVASARREDIPYIKCQVCEKLASQLYNQVQSKQALISPKKVLLRFCAVFIVLLLSFLIKCCSIQFEHLQLSEFQIIEIAENVCNLKKQEADWILKIDIVEKDDRLEVTSPLSLFLSFDRLSSIRVSGYGLLFPSWFWICNWSLLAFS